MDSASPALNRRTPDEVMTLTTLGAMFPTRLSFMRLLLRRIARDEWQMDAPRLSLDAQGYGTAVYTIRTPQRAYSLVAFSQAIPDESRTDRVIAEVWDTTYVLYDGIPDQAEMDRLANCVPLQEAGRFTPRELVLSRANKSIRMFEHVADKLAAGEQPALADLRRVGYLMRTTAVYGNGKFGIADRSRIADRAEFQAPFQAEMLTVWLIRLFTLDLVEHVARHRGGASAVLLAGHTRRFIGIGNATGLGMAPFLINHPELIGRWIEARETAVARVRAIATPTQTEIGTFLSCAERALSYLREWQVEDDGYAARIRTTTGEIESLVTWVRSITDPTYLWDQVTSHALAKFSPDGAEMTLSLILEPYGDLIDDLGTSMSLADGTPIRADQTLSDLRSRLVAAYGWALGPDMSQEQRHHFWYVSAAKQEPRLGEIGEDEGDDKAFAFDYAFQARSLLAAIDSLPPDADVGSLLLHHPELLDIVERLEIQQAQPYAEIRENLVGPDLVPLALLRCKLAFFGAAKFDPLSDKWLRVTLFQGAPSCIADLQQAPDDWIFSHSGSEH